jgi:hypothetical protein
MTPWRWWIGEADIVDSESQYDADCDTREAAIAWANREYPAGTPFYIIEARSSEDRRHEESDLVPFLRSRNKERLVTPDPSHATPSPE